MSTTVYGSFSGINTASITCTTPLSASISATVTIASLIITPFSSIVTVKSEPSSVVTIIPSLKSVE